MAAVDWFAADNYWLGRLVFQRALAAVYLVAFLVAVNQYRALLGSRGLTPIPRFVRAVPFRRAPSLFHLHYSDRAFSGVCWSGALLAAATLVGVTERLPLPAGMAVWALMWVGYLSIVNVGQVWYGYGWESLLLETGFLAIFLGGLSVAPPFLILLLVRWLLFRLEFGAGLIKLRGDPCWRNLTCLYYHHETQPMPGPFSWHFHQLPRLLHRVEVGANHVAQLVVPFGLFFPQPVAGVAAAVMIVTQLWLVASGNFSWLNWLAIVLALSVVPDSWLSQVLAMPSTSAATPAPYVGVVAAATVVVVILSYWPAANMLSRRQRMNISFDRLHLVNSYGAFGSVTKERLEVVVEGTADRRATPQTRWHEYEFKGKPGDPQRRPRQFAPYHLRLDWQMWFAALSPAYPTRWFHTFARRLLEGDRTTLRLLRRNPFPDQPPALVRARLYRYRYTTRAERHRTGAWWHRTLLGEYLPPTGSQQGSGGVSPYSGRA